MTLWLKTLRSRTINDFPASPPDFDATRMSSTSLSRYVVLLSLQRIRNLRFSLNLQAMLRPFDGSKKGAKDQETEDGLLEDIELDDVDAEGEEEQEINEEDEATLDEVESEALDDLPEVEDGPDITEADCKKTLWKVSPLFCQSYLGQCFSGVGWSMFSSLQRPERGSDTA